MVQTHVVLDFVGKHVCPVPIIGADPRLFSQQLAHANWGGGHGAGHHAASRVRGEDVDNMPVRMI